MNIIKTCLNIFIIIVFSTMGVNAQSIEQALEKHLTFDVPQLKVEKLANSLNQYTLLDAREFEEYNVSKIENALFIGYNEFDINDFLKLELPKNQKIVVYCSIGVRSEKIARQILNATHYEVYNLYGGIFDWKNKSYPVVNRNNEETESVHAYSKKWSKFLINAKAVY